MDNDIFFLVNILNDNHYLEKVDEEFDMKVYDMLKTDSLDEEISMKFEGNPFSVTLNGFSDTSDLNNYLLESLTQFKKIAIATGLVKNKVLQNEIAQRIFATRINLGQLKLENNNTLFSNYIPLINLKINYCDKTLEFISNIKIETLKLSGKKKGDNSNLTQKQVSLLFYYLQKYGYVGKKINKEDFTKLISEITDYSEEQFRKDFSHIEKISPIDDYGFQSLDFELVISSLRKMIKILEGSREKFSPKQ